ncbi:hypothetical protein GP486_008666 [Trichoglossum hirsutum]|uniref:Uncharacterized protein n=1 Tax=Trichoglossum hirsutum TaxID=265104 RepID=A0A9P8I2H6_9PEZI|nr:hypothetical protein GP486_008666 [Trichoglossum hirsutum]
MFKSLQEKATKLAAQHVGGEEKKKEKKKDKAVEQPPQHADNPAGEGSSAPPQEKEQKEDYLDKGFGMAAKKFGLKTDAKTNEKITDGARGFFEKASGKKVPEKISN